MYLFVDTGTSKASTTVKSYSLLPPVACRNCAGLVASGSTQIVYSAVWSTVDGMITFNYDSRDGSPTINNFHLIIIGYD